MDKSWLLRAEKKEDESSQSLPLNTRSQLEPRTSPGRTWDGLRRHNGPNSANYLDWL